MDKATVRMFAITAAASFGAAAPTFGMAQEKHALRSALDCLATEGSVGLERRRGPAEPALENASTALPAHLYCAVDSGEPGLRSDLAEIWVAVRDHTHAAGVGVRACVLAADGFTSWCGPYTHTSAEGTGLAHLSPSKSVWLASDSTETAWLVVELPPADPDAALTGRSSVTGHRWYDTDD